MTDVKLHPNETMTIEGDDWHELRLRNIGGSEIAGLFDLQQPYQLSRYGLFMIKSKRKRVLYQRRKERFAEKSGRPSFFQFFPL